jgi:hypothetical protein
MNPYGQAFSSQAKRFKTTSPYKELSKLVERLI